MALNPVAFTEKVVSSFLRYQLTAYPFADPDLYEQMRRLLSLEATRDTPLLKGPYISLSRGFREGARVADLIKDGLLHPFLDNLVEHPRLYGHQEQAIRAILGGRTTIVSTGTGSGKTECFLYPIISRCLALRDQHAPPAIVAVLVYPMNALAEDQLLRLRGLLAGTAIPFAMYVGKTPERKADVTGERPPGGSRAEYQTRLARARRERRATAVHPAEERCSREEMRTPGQQPRILLTNVKQLELLLTRQADIELFAGATLEFLVFDEAHTYSGAAGAETACLIRRLRAYCNRDPRQTVCIATSATIADPERGSSEGVEFAARFFGVDRNEVSLIGEECAPEIWAETRRHTPAPPGDPKDHLRRVLEAIERSSGDPGAMVEPFRTLAGEAIEPNRWREDLYDRLSASQVAYQIASSLAKPRRLGDLREELRGKIGRDISEEEILTWLFDEEGNVRSQVFDASGLGSVIEAHRPRVIEAVRSVFAQGWPSEDFDSVSGGALERHVRQMHDQLAGVIRTLKRRLDWALDQMHRLEEVRRRKGTLDIDEQSLYRRCDRLVKRYKGLIRRERQEAEGYDDTNTYAALAAEGFLPGYGLEIGSVRGTAQLPRHFAGAAELPLPRPPAVALREYVPGNLIYANGHRFLPRFYHLRVDRDAAGGSESVLEPTVFRVDVASPCVWSVGRAGRLSHRKSNFSTLPTTTGSDAIAASSAWRSLRTS